MSISRAVFTLLLFASPIALSQDATAPWLASAFSQEPATALVHRLTPAQGSGDAALVRTDPSSGARLEQRIQPVPNWGGVKIDTAVVGAPASAAPAPIRLLDWAFQPGESAAVQRYRPLEPRNDTWYGSRYWSGPDWCRVGKDWHHPGENTPSVRRFTAPQDGRIRITGRVRKADTNSGGGDGIRAEIRLNAQVLWKFEINGNDDKGVEHDVTADVRAGDALRFVVHKRGAIPFDTTYWDPAVAYEGGQRFQASEGFNPDPPCAGAWAYEMDTEPTDTVAPPTLYGFAKDGTLRVSPLSPGTSCECAAARDMAWLVLADAGDAGGLAFALPDAPEWRVAIESSPEGRLSFRVEAGAAVPLYAGAFQGGWANGMMLLRALSEAGAAGMAAWPSTQAVGAFTVPRPDMDLWAQVQAEWHAEDGLAQDGAAQDGAAQDGAAKDGAAYVEAARRHLDKMKKLLADVQALPGAPDLAAEAGAVEALSATLVRADISPEDGCAAYTAVRALKRHIALRNPLMQFGDLLFCKRVPTSYSHLVMQYYGWRARPGGGLYALERPGFSTRARRILCAEGQEASAPQTDSTAQAATCLPPGNILEPRLSFDATRIVFAYVPAGTYASNIDALDNTTDAGFYHIFEIGVDGQGLRQLTSGPYDDVMATYLPDGGIAFCSSRRMGYARCFGGQFSRRWHVYTLHRMEGDGSGLRTLSFHDTNEWFPCVSNEGLIVYARWDYIDRDAVTHQNLWASRPDGTNPVAVWGNASPKPHCAFQAQPIPNSRCLVFTASAHHSITGGCIVVVDPEISNNAEAALTRITPEVAFPEAETRDIQQYYEAPWPLSERYFLVAYSPTPLLWEPEANAANAVGLYLLDADGNRELLYRDPAIGATNPCPLRARPRPPIVPSQLYASEHPNTGEMLLADVRQGLGAVEPGRIKALRIVQIFPKTTNVAGTPPIGAAGEENARAILGTVPVEPDGSAHFEVPSRVPLLFQALDAEGCAYQVMRSVTYVQPGERVSCAGCHEPRLATPTPNKPAPLPAAWGRPASQIAAGPLDGRPFSFQEVVQPVLDKHCTSCHSGEDPKGKLDLSGAPLNGFTRAYWALCGDPNAQGQGANPQEATKELVPRFRARNQLQVTPPGGQYTAIGSRLFQQLKEGHHKVQLSSEEFQRLASWLDCNAVFYGVYAPEDQAKQLAGEPMPMPAIQ